MSGHGQHLRDARRVPGTRAAQRDRRGRLRVGPAGRHLVAEQRRRGHWRRRRRHAPSGHVRGRHVRHVRAHAAGSSTRSPRRRAARRSDGGQHPPARRPHLRQQPAAPRGGDHRARGDARGASRRPDHRRLPARVGAAARLGGGDAPGARRSRCATRSRCSTAPDASTCTIPAIAAHTTGDLVAWLPDERVLFSGDLVFHGLTPLVFMGSVDGALRSLDWLAAFEPGARRAGPRRAVRRPAAR